jgi:hypothetical protein
MSTDHYITFSKEYYHLNGEMEQWCKNNVGPGKWIGGTLKTWEGMEPNVWVMESMFGNTTFTFKDPRHLTYFLLRFS